MAIQTASSAVLPPPLPRLAKAGAGTIAFGLLFDLVEHTLVFRGPVSGGFPAEEHLAHLIVVVGMVMVLTGIVRDGVRTARRRDRHERI